ncbi:MAG: TRAP transporter substrate-binding protein DctP [Gammaproteobacteria bacterium]|nr:TRAP transporter substrate-binding protein DctP [Gammaproteobacteria bacterium]
MTALKFTVLALAVIFSSGVVNAQTFKIATVAPEGSVWMEEMRAAAAEIKAATEGRVIVKYYGGGVMGNDRKVLRKMRIGQLHGGAFAASGLLERYPDLSIYGLPLLFNSLEEIDYIQANIDADLMADMERSGLVAFGSAGGGFAYLMGNQPARTIEDLQGKKTWVPEGDAVTYASMETMRLSPVVLPISDVLTGLQTGLLDYVATPTSAALLLQWYTKVKYVTVQPIAYAIGIMAIEKKAFEKMSVADQEVFRAAMAKTYTKFNQINREDNIKAVAAMKANGIEFIEPASGAIDAWVGRVNDSNRKIWLEGDYSPELLDRVEKLLADFRVNQ